MTKAHYGPKRKKGLLDNYRSLTIVAALLILSFSSYAQYDSAKVRQAQNSYGFDWKNAKFNSSLIIPNDTLKLALKDSGAIAIKNGGLFSYNGQYWTKAGGTATLLGYLMKLDSLGGVQRINVDSIKLDSLLNARGGSTDTSLIREIVSDSSKRFGIEDNLGLQNRKMNIGNNDFEIISKTYDVDNFGASIGMVNFRNQILLETRSTGSGTLLVLDTTYVEITAQDADLNSKILTVSPKNVTINGNDVVTSVKVNGTTVLADSTGLADLGTISGGGSADDSALVHRTGYEVIGGNKVFDRSIELWRLSNFGTTPVFGGPIKIGGLSNNSGIYPNTELLFGYNTLQNLDESNLTIAIGNNTMPDATGTYGNLLFGHNIGYLLNSANDVIAIGNNTLGINAAEDDDIFYLSDGIYIGSGVKPSATSATNEIVIGKGGLGIGSNSVSIGNATTSKTQLLGNVGIGTSSPATKLHVAGSFRLANGTQGAGKVLTSDANGTATWETASGGTTKYSTTEYGMLTDSATANLYEFRVDSTVMESQARAVNRAAILQASIDAITRQSVLGYKNYTVTLTQSGSSAPFATILDDMVTGVTLARTSAGVYTLTKTGSWTAGKTMPLNDIFIDEPGNIYRLEWISADVMRLTTYSYLDTTVPADGVLSNRLITIQIYN